MSTKLPVPFNRPKRVMVRRLGLETADLPPDPIYGVPLDPDAPDDHEPLPDAMQQLKHVYDAVQTLEAFFYGTPGVLVSGDTPVYYLDEEGSQRTIYPDCYVAIGVNPISIRRRNGYFIREAGRPPAFVLEVASETTHTNDTGPKRDLYARLGVGEYWRFDATEEFYPEPLAGERLVNGEYIAIETVRGTDGILRGHSETLGLDLCWDDGFLHFYDPVDETYLRNLVEAEELIKGESAARRAAEGRADAAEERIRQLEEQLRSGRQEE